MIDIKAIRAAAKDTPYVWMSLLQPKTVLALLDEIEKLQKENEKLLEIFKVKHHAALRFFEKEAALEAKLVGAEKDAARYRWLVEYFVSDRTDLDDALVGASDLGVEQVAAVIDAAMESK